MNALRSFLGHAVTVGDVLAAVGAIAAAGYGLWVYKGYLDAQEGL